MEETEVELLDTPVSLVHNLIMLQETFAICISLIDEMLLPETMNLLIVKTN